MAMVEVVSMFCRHSKSVFGGTLENIFYYVPTETLFVLRKSNLT